MGTAVLLLLVMMLVIGTLDYDDHHSQGGEMAAGVRERMVAGAVRLLAQHGLQATSFSTVLATTKAPRGSIYHHFPGGKDELVTAAIGSAEQHALALLDQQVGASAVAVAESFLGAWRTLLTRAGYEIGCALVAVTVAAESPELRERTASAFGAWRQKLASALLAGGLAEADADAAAALLLAASEGAVVICRAERDIAHFDLVASQVVEYVRRLADAAASRAGSRSPG
jgi:TetR/AcrR family transcriptional repressor of lmrAB and yxaGH operons